jgi:hypothetical protein
MEVNLDSTEAQELAALKETQRLRRLEAVLRVRKEAAEAAAAEAVKALAPAAEVAEVISATILAGGKAHVEFEGADGQVRLADVRDKGPRATKEDTQEMRDRLNLNGVSAFDVLKADGFNGLRAFWKPGKSTCMDDRGFSKIFHALQSLESRTGHMSERAYAVLLPVLKLMRRRAH